MQTHDQKYATIIYEQIQQVREKPKAIYRKYGVMCHKLPILIHTAGLAQALAFVESRTSKQEIYKDFLCDLGHTIELKEKLVETVRKAELNEYMRLTTQVMNALVWYKRFAQSILGVDASDKEDEEV